MKAKCSYVTRGWVLAGLLGLVPVVGKAEPCTISITNPSAAIAFVAGEVSILTLQGTSVSATGNLNWFNQANAAAGSTPASSSWTAPGIPLVIGTNIIVVSGGGTGDPEMTTNAFDNGSDSAYASSWPNGSNGGAGFGGWNLFTTAGSPDNGGLFMAQGSTGQSIGPRAWGMYANSGNTTWAERPFSSPLLVGQTFRCHFENNTINADGIVAVHLSNSDSEHLWFFEMQGNENFYRMSDQVTTIPKTDDGLEISFTLTAATQYEVTVSGVGFTQTISGALEARANMSIDRTRFWNINAGPDGIRNFYFNDIAILGSDVGVAPCSATVTVIRAGTPPVTGTGNLPLSQPYVEADGFVGGEAEFYHARTSGGGVSWEFVPANSPGSFANAQGIGYMQARPDAGNPNTSYATGPSLDYKLQITIPGIYILWLRYDGPNDSGDSMFAGIVELADGPGGNVDWYQLYGNADANFNTTPWDPLGGFEANEPAPSRISMAFNIPAAGIYTLRVVPREDGVALDSWILQRPMPYRADPTDTNPIITVPDAIIMHHQTKAGIDVLRNDSGNINPATLQVVTPPAYGTATPMADGRMLYQHTAGMPAEDSFTYRVGGPGGSNSSPASVMITFSADLRIPNTTVTMPLTPPPTTFSVADAFPGITFTAPTAMASPPGDTNRIFVAQRNGQIFVITGISGPNPQKILFMDISGRVQNDGNELGLKGIGFHPDYANNRYLYLSYCHRTGGGEDFVRLSRFQTQAGNPNAGDANSELMLINHRNFLNVHNINNIVFGPDGYLYLGMGDEGFTGPGPDGRNNSQVIDKDMWSAILRIDVDKKAGNLAPNSHAGIPLDGGNARFSIPANNPFVGATSFNGLSVNPNNVRTEFFAVGLRNPWQFSFDELTGEMWVADVGNSAREEVTIMPPGANGGWVFFEGTLAGPRLDRTPPPGFTYARPVWEYTHGFGEFQGLSIIGGFVYRGANYSSLYGKYLCADYVSGNIWTIERTSGATNVVRITGEGGLIAFALNPANGDIIMLDHGDGRIRRLIAQSDGADFPETLSETGFFANLADLSPNPGVIAYEPNLSFWSDYGVKSRWFVITNTADRIGLSRDGNWIYPNGMMWVKHFDIEMERGNPDTKKRLETRVLVKNPGGSYGVSYQWNEAETQATLVPDAGVNFNLSITNNEVQVVQDWRIPSRAECLVCHNPAGGHALSFNTRQLNCPGTIGNASGNFITLLENAGYTSNSLGNPALIDRYVGPDEDEYSLEVRARSYLAVNCGYCHMGAESVVPGAFDTRAFVKLHDTAMVLGSAASNGGNTNNLLLVPADTTHSIIWNRVGASNNFSRMPPLGSTEIDHVSVQLLAAWINGELPDRQSFTDWQIDRFGSTNHPNAAASADPDEDGRANYEEFLTYTDPNDPLHYWSADFAEDGGQYYLTHDLAHRAVWVETSTSLVNAAWAFWNIPENNGLPIGPNAVRYLPVPGDVTNLFFRFKLDDR